jgi:hypothetical protein
VHAIGKVGSGTRTDQDQARSLWSLCSTVRKPSLEAASRDVRGHDAYYGISGHCRKYIERWSGTGARHFAGRVVAPKVAAILDDFA